MFLTLGKYRPCSRTYRLPIPTTEVVLTASIGSCSMKALRTLTFAASLKDYSKAIALRHGACLVAKQMIQRSSNASKSFDDNWSRYIANRRYKQFVEGLNMLYSNDKNSKIEIQHGLWIVMNIISGIPDANLEKMIEAWRQKDGEH